MLAASMDTAAGESIDTLSFPVLATPKIDGIRCLIIKGKAMSRSLKPIPNAFIQAVLGKPEFNGLDGELLVGSTFQQATSGIMSEDGQPDFTYYAFDLWDMPNAPYTERMKALATTPDTLRPRVKTVLPLKIENPADLREYLAECLEDGFEGVMVRDPAGLYKHGRATFKSGWLTKVKPFEDAEAEVINFEERYHNANEAKTNALGRTERSSHQANMVPTGTLGALVCRNEAKWPGRSFNIGTGFDDALRASIWANRDRHMGSTVKFKFQAIGTKDVPRIPVFLGFRDPKDMSN
jgi:DNA ligase 1